VEKVEHKAVELKVVDAGPTVKHSITIQVMTDGQIKVESYTVEETQGGTPIQRPMTVGRERGLIRDALDAVNDQAVAMMCSAFIDNALKQKIQPNGFRSTSVGKFLLGK
jgi:archaellum component FlaG (FlaF/FlaG flagellin family)